MPAYVSVNVAVPMRVPVKSRIVAVADVPPAGGDGAAVGAAGGRAGAVGEGLGGE
jgi:hypothetical protein